MGTELGELESEGEVIPVLQQRPVADDLVGRQSERLAGAIDHMRDLRRFVADTLEHMPDPLMVTDLDGGITLTNELLDESLGHDVTGANFNDVLNEIVHPQFRRQVDAYLKTATRDDRAAETDTGSHFVRFDSARDRTFVLRTAAIRTDADELRGHIHYFADITDLARAETDREIALQLLSHDMRAPQSAIIALLPDIANKPAGERIERHARRTMQLAQDFVDIARMGESAFEGVDILLADLVRDVADNMWPLAREKDVNIQVADESGQAFVFAEPDSLSRALSNLFDNAIKYSPNGGTIHAIVKRLQANGVASISVCIEDEGEGIETGIASRLFERFASNRSDSARVKGIGLGLAFVRAVAEKHQGQVFAENRSEGGARFVLSLPEAPEPADGEHS